jgi:AcrR family transcriptional regulator
VTPRRTPGQRAGLDRRSVLQAAHAALAEGGPEALTMRGLAQRLGVAPNALYSHVSGKTGLIDDMLDDALGDIRSPQPDTRDPRDGLRKMMTSSYDVLMAHPHLVPLYLARQGSRGPQAQRLGENMRALLERAGVRGPGADEALRVLIVYTMGFAAFAPRPPLDPGDARPISQAQSRDMFVAGLTWLITGVIAGDVRAAG